MTGTFSMIHVFNAYSAFSCGPISMHYEVNPHAHTMLPGAGSGIFYLSSALDHSIRPGIQTENIKDLMQSLLIKKSTTEIRCAFVSRSVHWSLVKKTVWISGTIHHQGSFSQRSAELCVWVIVLPYIILQPVLSQRIRPRRGASLHKQWAVIYPKITSLAAVIVLNHQTNAPVLNVLHKIE